MKKILKAIWEFIEDFGVTILLLLTIIVLAYLVYTL